MAKRASRLGQCVNGKPAGLKIQAGLTTGCQGSDRILKQIDFERYLSIRILKVLQNTPCMIKIKVP